MKTILHKKTKPTAFAMGFVNLLRRAYSQQHIGQQQSGHSGHSGQALHSLTFALQVVFCLVVLPAYTTAPIASIAILMLIAIFFITVSFKLINKFFSEKSTKQFQAGGNSRKNNWKKLFRILKGKSFLKKLWLRLNPHLQRSDKRSRSNIAKDCTFHLDSSHCKDLDFRREHFAQCNHHRHNSAPSTHRFLTANKSRSRLVVPSKRKSMKRGQSQRIS